MLQGKLTYIGGSIIIIGSFVGLFLNKLTYEQFVITLGAGVSIVGLRRAISNNPKEDKQNEESVFDKHSMP